MSSPIRIYVYLICGIGLHDEVNFHRVTSASESRVNGGDPCSSKIVNFNQSPKLHLWINWFEIWQGWSSRVLPTPRTLKKVMSAVVPPRGPEIYGSRAINFLVFVFLNTRIQSIPVNQFQSTIAQKTRTDSRKCPLGEYFSIFPIFGRLFLQKQNKMPLPIGKPHANKRCPFELVQ